MAEKGARGLRRPAGTAVILSLVLGLALAGCAPAPSPKPLSSEAINAALAPPGMEALRVQAQSIHHPLLPPLELDDRDGLSPDEAAIVAVLANPSLRAVRDGRGIALAQVLQAGILPNPSLTWGNEFPYAGADTLVAYSVGVSWEINELISRGTRLQAAGAQAVSVDLDIAWQEWQVAQSAKAAAYSLLSVQAQLELARQADELLQQNLQTVQKGLDAQQKTAVDLSAAQAAGQEAHAAVLELQREQAKQTIALNRLLGLPPDAAVKLQPVELPASLQPPADLAPGLEDRRLDLLALRRGYDSQEATLRAAVLSRFPKFGLGGSNARDTGGVYTFGYEVSADLPLFDRNQGAIALEQATREKLFDEFTNRLFEARSDVAAAMADIASLNGQIAFAASAVPVLEKLVADYEKALNAGTADVLSYYTARNDLSKQKLEVVKLKGELIAGWIALENACGTSLALAGSLPRGPAGASSQPASAASSLERSR